MQLLLSTNVDISYLFQSQADMANLMQYQEWRDK